MAHLLPRQPSHQAHRRTHSTPQTTNKRVEIVSKLEDCIGDLLEATKAFKSPQQQSAHQNANLIFQQRLLATQGHMGPTSDQDWLGTMMQCLNESMRSQQSSFVRNTSLDVALKAFASAVFETLGTTYFQEPFEKYRIASNHSNGTQGTTTAHIGRNLSGIPSPPRELGPTQALLQRTNTQQLQTPTAMPHQFPSSHHAPMTVPRQSAPVLPVQQLHGMPSGYPQAPQAPSQTRPVKRSSTVDRTNASHRRNYASEALRQAAGTMGPPPQAPVVVDLPQRPTCVNFADVRKEKDPRHRQAILGYERKWFVFRCYKHQDPIWLRTAEGAKHHLVTHHAQPHQHIDLFDMIRELGVEVVNCDAARAEMNNNEAVIVWGQRSNAPQPKVAIPHQAAMQRARVEVHPPVAALTLQPAKSSSHLANAMPIAKSPVKVDSPSAILISDDELLDEMATTESTITIKQDADDDAMIDLKSVPAPRETRSDETSRLSTNSSQGTGGAAEWDKTLNTESVQVAVATADMRSSKPLTERFTSQQREAPPAETVVSKHTDTKVADILADIPEPPEMIPDSPESSALSEPPSLQELEVFDLGVVRQDSEAKEKEGLEDGEIEESCIKVSPLPPPKSDHCSSPRKRRISASGSEPGTPMKKRKRLPSTPNLSSSSQKKKDRQTFWSADQETGPSAHDQFKTRACKKCKERFYFRAQLATHMKEEHPEVVLLS